MATSATPTADKIHLVGTFTRYSSWTARIETILTYFRIPHTAIYIPLSQVSTRSPSGLAPVLIVPPSLANPAHPPSAPLTVTDSLSIAEFLAELHPSIPLWPSDPYLRALARSATAAMHSGFSLLREHCGTNFIARYSGPGLRQHVEICDGEVEKMLRLWGEARRVTVERLRELDQSEKDEGFLFGGFSIADAFFWPVLWRFRTYELSLKSASPEALAWMGLMWDETVLRGLGKEYFMQAERAETRVQKYDDVFKNVDGVKSGTFEEEWKFMVPA